MYEGGVSAEEWMDFDEQEARAAADAEEAEREAADYESWQMEREAEERELRGDGKTHVFEADSDKEFVVGGRVRCEWQDGPAKTRIQYGRVTAISDPDGDVDDEGRTIGYNPVVTVRWDDGTKEDIATYNHSTGWDGYMADPVWEAEEIEVV